MIINYQRQLINGPINEDILIFLPQKIICFALSNIFFHILLVFRTLICPLQQQQHFFSSADFLFKSSFSNNSFRMSNYLDPDKDQLDNV